MKTAYKVTSARKSKMVTLCNTIEAVLSVDNPHVVSSTDNDEPTFAATFRENSRK